MSFSFASFDRRDFGADAEVEPFEALALPLTGVLRGG